jgi:hypothetical protein
MDNSIDRVFIILKQNERDGFERARGYLDSIQQAEEFPFILDFLQDLGLISYSLNDGSASLTRTGVHTDRVFQG